MPLFGRRDSLQSARHVRLSQDAQDDEMDAAFNDSDEAAPLNVDKSHDDEDDDQFYNASSTSRSGHARNENASESSNIEGQADRDPLLASSTSSYPPNSPPRTSFQSRTTPGAYDFELSVADQPLPSSAPVLPEPPMTSSALSAARNRTLRARLANATNSLFGRYNPLATSDPDAPAGGRTLTGPNRNDGVFANLTAKPERRREDRQEWVGGDDEGNGKEMPPTYEAAAADTTPPYWETTIMSPHQFGYMESDEILIEGLPVGTIFSFAWNMLISMSFQMVGFLLTYLLHTSHAARNGSRAGLGVTLIQYAFYLRQRATVLDQEIADGEIPPELIGPDGQFLGGRIGLPGNRTAQEDGWAAIWGPLPSTAEIGTSVSGVVGSIKATATAGLESHPSTLPELTEVQRQGLQDAMEMSSLANDWLSYCLMIIGWALLIGAILSFWRAWRWGKAMKEAANGSSAQEQGVASG